MESMIIRAYREAEAEIAAEIKERGGVLKVAKARTNKRKKIKTKFSTGIFQKLNGKG